MRRSTRRLRVALAQLRCHPDPGRNRAAARRAVEEAARRRASLCVLPELFAHRYPGQFEDVRAFLTRVPDPSDLIDEFRDVASRRAISLVLPYFETGPGSAHHNSLVVIDGLGRVRGRYRKAHIPNGEGYREARFFRPGDTDYPVVSLNGLRLGTAICWDQWFPEVSRALALRGADLIVYPSAIGSEPADPAFDSRPDWELVMRAQAIVNRVFVAAVNRVGPEERIRFYGGSFVSDPWGRVIARASRRRPELRVVDLDLEEIGRARDFFGFFDTRRPDTYAALTADGGPGTRTRGTRRAGTRRGATDARRRVASSKSRWTSRVDFRTGLPRNPVRTAVSGNSEDGGSLRGRSGRIGGIG
jgi:N-carbamoylputrescine amidase